MIDVNSALQLMKKYGYNSTSLHPYLYKRDNRIGICYSYVDDNFGILERVNFFSTLEEMEDFLKEYQWYKQNGKNNNVRMVLDNYEIVDPKVVYLRNEKVMVKGEMFNIEQFDMMEEKKKEMDQLSRILLECSNMLMYYDENKKKQLDFFTKYLNLKNELRQKYFDLQKEVDKYNEVDIDRQIRLLPTALSDTGINQAMEIATKDRLSQYKASNPPMEEAIGFIKDVWELCMNLELNENYYNSQIEENNLINEIKIVDEKMEYMKKINSKKKSIFGNNVVKAFRKINKLGRNESNILSPDYVSNNLDNIKKKYANYDKLDYLSITDYLKEASQNSDYASLVTKYCPKSNVDSNEIVRLPINEIVADLSKQYLGKLNVNEQTILTLYNSKFKNLVEYILQIPDFKNKTVEEIMKELNKKSDIGKIKTECFDILRNKLDEANNLNIKKKVFSQINFDSFEMFIQSLKNYLIILLDINEKMVLNSDLPMYFKLSSFKDLETKYVYPLTDDLNSLVADLKNEEMIGLVLLKKGTPILYSPYYVDFGNIYGKDSDNVPIEIKEASNMKMLIDINDVIIMRDENLITVMRYFSEPKKEDNISIVDELKNGGKTTFCKFTMKNNNNSNTQVTEVNNVKGDGVNEGSA